MDRFPLVRVTPLLFALLSSAVGSSAAQARTRPAEAPAQVSMKQFRDLRWLADNWRGQASGEKPFYEGYRFTDDSTLVMTYYADSTLSRTTGTGSVELRGGRVYHRSGKALWVVTRFNASEIHFAPLERASNSFVWKRDSTAGWTASLFYPNRPAAIYSMRRIPNQRAGKLLS